MKILVALLPGPKSASALSAVPGLANQSSLASTLSTLTAEGQLTSSGAHNRHTGAGVYSLTAEVITF